jgi:hypothetical protein
MLFGAILAYGALTSDSDAHETDTQIELQPPVRLTVDGKPIDTGKSWGHSSPALEDLDGDGLKDLVVGDFSGKFRWYRNSGTAKQPEFRDAKFIKGGSEDAAVRIYCCIGGQPRFHDLNGDGLKDMIANSYDPGHCYVFWGREGNQFSAREELVDKAGIPIRSSPVQKQDYHSFGSFFELVDWDHDGDLDMLIGRFEGDLKIRLNEGTSTKPLFASENIDVLVSGKPLKVKAHLCPKVADWDSDGVWDLIAGSDDGSVTFFRNIGDNKSPNFAEGIELLNACEGVGYDFAYWNELEIKPGIRSQVEVADFNGDGKLDLIVGDFYTAFDFKLDLSPEQKSTALQMINEREARSAKMQEQSEALRKQFEEKYPGDLLLSEQAEKEWAEASQAMSQSKEAIDFQNFDSTFTKSIRPFLASTHGKGDKSYELAIPHGHVCVLLRK